MCATVVILKKKKNIQQTKGKSVSGALTDAHAGDRSQFAY